MKMKHSGNSYMSVINSENTVKHDKQYQHKKLANTVNTERLIHFACRRT